MVSKFNFNSFFWAGFECADHINRSGERINLQQETQHDVRIYEDYLLISSMGIRVAREGICWSQCEKAPFVFDFSHLIPFYAAAKKHGIQIVWDLCHFGYPDGLIPTHPKFVSRFTALCVAFAKFHAQLSQQPLYVVPINEISFLSWHSGDVRGTVPFAIHSGDDIKYHLCKAAIAGTKVLKEIMPDCVVFGVEPLIKIHAADDSITPAEIEKLNQNQFTAMDIVMGRTHPELGGHPDLIDILGFNYYYNNQWDHKNQPMNWLDIAKPHTPFSELLHLAYRRYNKPVVVTETGHFGEHRDLWIKKITIECLRAMNMGVDLHGLCIYPVIDRPDWDDLSLYSKSGIWDFNENKDRIADSGYVKACLKSMHLVFRHQQMKHINRKTKTITPHIKSKV